MRVINQQFLFPGDHIKVRRWRAGPMPVPTSFTHHGIYVGKGKVVDLSKPDVTERRGRFGLVSLEDFAKPSGTKAISIVHYDEMDRFERDEVVKRARGLLGDDVEYSLFSHNCEHVATWCVTDRMESSQVRLAGGVGAGTLLMSPLLPSAGRALRSLLSSEDQPV